MQLFVVTMNDGMGEETKYHVIAKDIKPLEVWCKRETKRSDEQWTVEAVAAFYLDGFKQRYLDPLTLPTESKVSVEVLVA